MTGEPADGEDQVGEEGGDYGREVCLLDPGMDDVCRDHPQNCSLNEYFNISMVVIILDSMWQRK